MAEAAQVGSRKIEVARPLGEDQAVTPAVQRAPHIVADLLVAVVVVDQGHLSKGNLLVLGLIDGFRALLGLRGKRPLFKNLRSCKPLVETGIDEIWPCVGVSIHEI